MTRETIRFEVIDHVAYVTLNRPDAVNAINLDLARELMQVSILCDQDPAVRAVLLTGAGKMFCAGGDLRAMAAFGDNVSAGLKEMTLNLHGAMSHFACMSAPLIVAVNGAAAGAGMSLAIAGDFVIACKSASFVMAYTAAGLVPDGGSTYVMPRLIGTRRALELMITNRKLSAAEAADWGLINRVVEDDTLMDEAKALAQKLAQGPTRSFGEVKRLLKSSFTTDLETQMEQEGRAISGIARTHDGREGIAAFLNKRKPVFTGE
ncbi:MAG: enoyl-CoA hydratase/isomerase family protein [Rhodospirillales bacterium]|nr:enoyl-CoA hydratase/isomerase family protein [Rhodospirillales bacterium]